MKIKLSTELIIVFLLAGILFVSFIVSHQNMNNDWEEFYSDKMLLTELEHDHELLVKSISIRQGIYIINHKFSLEGVFCDEKGRLPYQNNYIEVDDKIKIVKEKGSVIIELSRNGKDYVFSNLFCTN